MIELPLNLRYKGTLHWCKALKTLTDLETGKRKVLAICQLSAYPPRDLLIRGSQLTVTRDHNQVTVLEVTP